MLSRFKASLTGDPDPSNPFIKHYAPFCIQEPLVVQTLMYASACYIHETGHLPRTALMASKGRAIHMLNQRISSGRNSAAASNTGNVWETSGTNDAAIASVIQLAAAEWYWGDNNEDVQHHFKGLRDMIRLRGGFDRLGMNGILAKNAIWYVGWVYDSALQHIWGLPFPFSWVSRRSVYCSSLYFALSRSLFRSDIFIHSSV